MHLRIILTCVALLASPVIFLSSCAEPAPSPPPPPAPSAEERCKYEGIDGAPIATGKVVAVTRAIAVDRSPAQGVLLCENRKEIDQMVGSALFHDAGVRGAVFIIWVNRVVLERADEPTLRFTIAHEFGHIMTGRGACPEESMVRYLECEHEVDVYATRVVGRDAAIYALRFYRQMLITRHAQKGNIDLLTTRIALLRKMKGLPK